MNITSEYLAQYTYLESQIKRLRRKYEYYKKNPIKSEYGVVTGSMPNFPYAQCHFVVTGPNIKSDEERQKIISQLLIDIKGNERLYEDMKLEIELFLEGIADLEMKTIMQMKYIDNMSMEKIGEELNYDKSSISRKIDKFLKSIEDATHATR
ncbi:uncharacterized protein DUF1492 [Lachnotalea glycerini]|uniref:Uncharacterized protein DUF1492 n=1 Tax=Lachnotalea glycerini TaxID=1763509 RepID=A0A318EQ00_9FIRM|nr:DUF1492 domain-containing protein [Lachnotalea glycerini]PXV88453.1 uncharacterized protein DUF1492 [Lachnotalea glycerini]